MSHREFKLERAKQIDAQSKDPEFRKLSHDWYIRANHHNYSYAFEWQGRPIIQYPQDIVALQEVVYQVKPDVIVETGIAHGGSAVFSASLLCLLDIEDGLDPRKSPRKVIAVDIDIRAHNKIALDTHPLRFKMELLEGCSVDSGMVRQVSELITADSRVLIYLDSNHTHDHVLSELNAYAGLVSKGSYCVVFDTAIENLPKNSFNDRPWGIGDNSGTAVREWLESHPEFEVDELIDRKLMVSVAPGGWLKRIT